MSWDISKQFNFAYGHRVWSQKLNSDFSLDRQCVCRHLHGHEAEVHVHLSGRELDSQGMVTDFLHLSWLKNFFDNTLDHKFIIDRSDPLFARMLGKDAGRQMLPVGIFRSATDDEPKTSGHVFDLGGLDDASPDKEYIESFFVVDFVPTSENLSRWLFDLTTFKMERLGVTVEGVDWWETPKSCARYRK